MDGETGIGIYKEGRAWRSPGWRWRWFTNCVWSVLGYVAISFVYCARLPLKYGDKGRRKKETMPYHRRFQAVVVLFMVSGSCSLGRHSVAEGLTIVDCSTRGSPVRKVVLTSVRSTIEVEVLAKRIVGMYGTPFALDTCIVILVEQYEYRSSLGHGYGNWPAHSAYP